MFVNGWTGHWGFIHGWRGCRPYTWRHLFGVIEDPTPYWDGVRPEGSWGRRIRVSRATLGVDMEYRSNAMT